MSNVLTPVTVSPGSYASIQLPHVNAVQAVKVTNGSPFDLTVSGFGVQGSTVIPNSTEYMLYSEVMNSGTLSLSAVNNLIFPPTATGIVNIVVYFEGEKLPPGVWPISIPAQQVTSTLDIAQQVINDGYAPGTHVVEAQEPGSPGSNVLIDNQGNFNISEVTAGVTRDFIHCYHGGDGFGHSVIIGDVTSGVVAVLNTLTVSGGEVVTAGTQHVSSGGGPTAMLRATQADGSLDIGAAPGAGSVRIGATGEVTAQGANNISLGTAGTDKNVLDYAGGTLYLKGSGSINVQVPGGSNMVKVTSNNNDPALSGNASTAAFAGDIKLGTTNGGLNNNYYFADGGKISSLRGVFGNSGVATNHLCNKQPQYWCAVPNSMNATPTTITTTALTATQITFTTGTGVAWRGYVLTFN